MKSALLLILLASSQPATARSAIDRYQQDGWHLSVEPDAFSGHVECRLFSRKARIVVRPGAVGFRLPDGSDVLHAEYRVDGGRVRRWRDEYPSLIAADIPIDGSRVDNGFDDIAWIPSGLLLDADRVDLRGGGDRKVRHFRLRGLRSVAASATGLGCPPFLVR